MRESTADALSNPIVDSLIELYSPSLPNKLISFGRFSPGTWIERLPSSVLIAFFSHLLFIVCPLHNTRANLSLLVIMFFEAFSLKNRYHCKLSNALYEKNILFTQAGASQRLKTKMDSSDGGRRLRADVIVLSVITLILTSGSFVVSAEPRK